MFYFHRRVVYPAVDPLRTARAVADDDRGAAALEGIIVVAILAGVLLGCMLLGQWGIHLQSAQMGARLLAFDAGDVSLAKFGRPGDEATQTFSSEAWDTLAGTVPAGWLNVMFVLPNERFSGSVTGTQHGRLPSEGASLFGFSPASLGYHSGSAAATNPWGASESEVRSTFLGVAYSVGFHQETPEALQSIPQIPSAIPIAESIYVRVGVR